MWEESKWYFMDGEPNGINDSGISEFKSTRYDGLAREIIQNSLDAKIKESNEPVEVMFKKNTFSMDKFPNVEDYLENIERCKLFIKNQPNNKAHKIYDNIITTVKTSIENNSFDVLEIADYNTVGLDGSINNDLDSVWSSLVRISGNNNKEADAGGSFGVGKYAPFVFSTTRSIIYSTKDMQGNVAVQGKTILSGHINKRKKSPVGYFGIIKSSKIKDSFNGEEYEQEDSFPFTNPMCFPEEYLRTSSGTSLFVMNANFGESWYKEIVISVLQNFTKTILENKLVIRIADSTTNMDDIVINASSLKSIVNDNRFYDEEKTTKIREHYKLLTIPNLERYEKTFDLSSVGYNEGKLKLLIMSNDEVTVKSLYYTRKNGMVIQEPSFNNLLPYVGIVTTKNNDMNNFLRECEGPKHDEWNGDNFRETEQEHSNAKKILNQIRKWVRETLKNCCGKQEREKLDVFGMEDLLPLEYDNSEKAGDNNELILFKPIDTPLELSKNKIKQKTKTKDDGFILDDNGDNFFEGGTDEHQGGTGKGDHPVNGGQPIKGTKGGEINSKKRVPISNVRAPFVSDRNSYRITFMPGETVNNCSIQIRRAGADIFEEINIKKLYVIDDGVRNEHENVLSLEKEKKVTLEVELDSAVRGALEVNCYVKK